MTVEEMGRRMTAQEFGEWQVFFRNEQLHPQADRLRHAQGIAAAMNGPVSRKTGGMFSAAELLPPDPWAPPAPEPQAPTAQDLASQIDALNQSLGGGA